MESERKKDQTGRKRRKFLFSDMVTRVLRVWGHRYARTNKLLPNLAIHERICLHGYARIGISNLILHLSPVNGRKIIKK